MKLRRIDPIFCGCSGCKSGVAKPLNQCTQDELKKLFNGNLENNSGRVVRIRYNPIYYTEGVRP